MTLRVWHWPRARAPVMGARFPIACWRIAQKAACKEAELPGQPPVDGSHGDFRQGFVYERVPHITLKSIANNGEIDVIWDKCQARLEPLRRELNAELGKKVGEWEIQREAASKWSAEGKGLRAAWWEGAMRAKPKSTSRLPRRPISNCSMTDPTKANPGFASRARSRSRACRRTASCQRIDE